MVAPSWVCSSPHTLSTAPLPTGSSKRIFYFYFQIIVLPTKILSFIFERVQDHAYKVYEGKESQTLIFGWFLIVIMQLGFDEFI